MENEFKVGDEVWWFQRNDERIGSYLWPGTIDLIHDYIKEIKDKEIICWHGRLSANQIWGKSRFEAWTRLKDELEKWGKLDGTS